MKIILSPAKKMNQNADYLAPRSMPVFLEKAERLKQHLQSLSREALKELLCCNDEIAALNFDRFQHMDLERNPTPAILAYEGIQYQYMAPQVFDYASLDYIDEHLRILSGFYGILKPFDGVVPYRLEMQAKLRTDFCASLYDYWSDSIFQELVREDGVILNLASAEYSKAVSRYLTPAVTYVTCCFGEIIDGRIREKGVYVKMARGEMVRFLADHSITDIGEIRGFQGLGYRYREDLSSKQKYVFIKSQEGNREGS